MIDEIQQILCVVRRRQNEWMELTGSTWNIIENNSGFFGDEFWGPQNQHHFLESHFTFTPEGFNGCTSKIEAFTIKNNWKVTLKKLRR